MSVKKRALDLRMFGRYKPDDRVRTWLVEYYKKRRLLEVSSERALAFLQTWNERLAPLIDAPTVRVNPATQAHRQRVERFKARSREWGDDLEKMIEDELRQANAWVRESTWMTLDWILSPKNLQKLLDGNYRRRTQTTARTQEIVQRTEEVVDVESARKHAERILRGRELGGARQPDGGSGAAAGEGPPW